MRLFGHDAPDRDDRRARAGGPRRRPAGRGRRGSAARPSPRPTPASRSSRALKPESATTSAAVRPRRSGSVGARAVAERRRPRVDVAQQRPRRDVVVAERRAARADGQRRLDRPAPDRVVQHDGAGAVEVAPARAQRAAPSRRARGGRARRRSRRRRPSRACSPAPGQRLAGHRVAGRGGRDELVDPHHAASRSATAAKRSCTAGQPYSSQHVRAPGGAQAASRRPGRPERVDARRGTRRRCEGQPPPQRATWSRITSEPAATSAGVPSSQASISTIDRLSISEGFTSATASA